MKTSPASHAGFFPTLVGWIASVFHYSERFAGPALGLMVRLWLAQAFFVSGVLKAANWENALYLAQHEYPVSWMSPVTAAWVGVLIELAGSVLLAAGLATRFAALAMLVLSVVIQAHYVALDITLLWIALLAWFAVRGAGALSIDHAIAPGLADSPLPFAARGVAVARWVTQFIAPLYLLALRIWLGVALFAGALSLALPSVLALWLPHGSAHHFAQLLSMAGALFLMTGFATRLAAVALLLGVAAVQMMDANLSVDFYWMLVFALLALHGAGRISVDALVQWLLRETYPQLAGKPAFSLEGLPRVVIVGAGFGGLACAASLRRAPVSVTLIDRHNYHLFQPLLYQVATAGLSPGDIATPVRGMFRESFNTRVLFGEVTQIDSARREVVAGEVRVPYDYLVLATGASHSYFGKDEWGPFAPGLKRVEDATEVRRRLLTAFELAEAAQDETERRSLLNFLIVGGGPTGVELAGAIAELAKFGMEKDFRRFDPSTARVILVQAGPRILPTFPEALSAHAAHSLAKLGVEVLVNSRVEQIDAAGVTVNGKRIPSKTALWAAGVVASPAAKWLGAPADAAGRLKAGPDLSVANHPNVYAIGDTASSTAWNGQPVPGLAPAAKQAGQYVARVIRARVLGRKPPPPFVYRHLGSLATIGRKAAVADFGFIKLSGAPAWWLWGLIHVGFLVGVRNRVSVMLDWFWSYLTFRGGTRLITGSPPPEGAIAAGKEKLVMIA
ncbi:MAG: FAD-dependent oxidoreductase [Burkholderiales bacterium]